ncbi:MAG: DUF3800 domain-containing protein [Proteobacteria bacterium]|nr:DUF3800 domain-containing protein [Pseudomonadota bacterium]
MIIYLDEAGDLGFDFSRKKTSRYLMMALLVCDDIKTRNSLSKAVTRTIKHKLPKMIPELKGSNTTHEIKRHLYTKLNSYEKWRIYAIVADKMSWLKRSPTIIDKNKFYDDVACQLLKQLKLPEELTGISLIVDRSKTSQEKLLKFNHSVQSTFNFFMSKGRTLMVEHKRSQEELLLQAVDMFCWGIYRKYQHQDTQWYDLFTKRIAVELIYKSEA